MHALLHNPSSTIEGFRPFDINVYRVLGVCNGLVCLLVSYRYSHSDFDEFWVRFWNPATRVISDDSPRVYLHNDRPRRYKRYMFGFGYDEWSDTYQAVVLDNNKPQNLEVRVHCMGHTGWKSTLTTTCPAFPILSQDGASVRGTVNWLALPNSSSDYQWETVTIDDLVIFSYDLKNESYRYLLMPDGLLEVPHYSPELVVLKGCLCLSHRHGGNHFGFWLMKEFGVEKSWTQLLKVSYEHLQSYSLLPLWMSENEDVILLESVGGYKFVLYNRRDNRVDWSEVFYDKLVLRSYDYVQSLVLPY